jgi:hypothetical protein
MPIFFPSFGTMPLIDFAIQIGRGAAAGVIGQTYDIRRLDDNTNGAISNNPPIFTAYPARVRRTTSKAAIENITFDTLIFQATCDNRVLRDGDLLTQTGYENDGSIFTMAQARPTRETLWVRTEATCSITRPMPTAGAASQQPANGIVATQGYSGFAKSTEIPLTLQNGMYSFSSDPNATQASVQVGIQPFNRIRDGNIKLPTALYREHFMIWVPMLPGEILNELDRVRFQNMDAYEVALIFSTDTVGLSGHICIVERINV